MKMEMRRSFQSGEPVLVRYGAGGECLGSIIDVGLTTMCQNVYRVMTEKFGVVIVQHSSLKRVPGFHYPLYVQASWDVDLPSPPAPPKPKRAVRKKQSSDYVQLEMRF